MKHRATQIAEQELKRLLLNEYSRGWQAGCKGKWPEHKPPTMPRTVMASVVTSLQALREAPIPHITGRSPMALFSMLKPGMHIVPHTGFLNTRLICHLPLLAPPGCRLRVGNEVRIWEEGKMLLFDDSIEHEAWNEGSETRVVLLFEIWRPEIGEADREALTVLYEHIAAYSD